MSLTEFPIPFENTAITYRKIHRVKPTFLLAWISNYIQCDVWNGITYPFLTFNGAGVEV